MIYYGVHDLGRMLLTIRTAMRLTTRELATELGIDRSTISRVENGKAVDYDTGKKLEGWIRQQEGTTIAIVYLHKDAQHDIARGDPISPSHYCSFDEGNEVQGCEGWAMFIAVNQGKKE